MPTQETEQLLPLQEAVQLATGRRFYRTTVHQWRKLGKLKAVKIGQLWLCTVEDVRSMMANEAKEAAKET